MSDKPESSGLVGAVQDIGGKLVTSLPAQFLVLVLFNTIFILGLFWFLTKQSESRERLMAPFFASCNNSVPMEVLKMMPKPELDERPFHDIEARIADLKASTGGGISREAWDDARQRAADRDRALQSQLEGVRSTLDAVRSEVMRTTSGARLVGPAR